MTEAEDEKFTKKSLLRKYAPFLLSLAALTFFSVYLYQHADRYRSLLRFSAGTLVGIASLVVVAIAMNGLVNYFLYRGLRAEVALNEAIGLAAANTLANQLPFAAGMITKGVYLRRRYQLPYPRFFSATIALYLVFLATAGVTGIFVMAGRFFAVGSTSPWLLLGFTAMSGSIVAFWLPLKQARIPQKWQKRLHQIVEGWQILRVQKSLLLKVVLAYLVMMISAAGRYWIAFHALSQNVTFAECLLFAAASILTQMVSTTPGGLGVREGIVAAVAAAHGVAADISIVAVSLDRLVATTIVIGVGSVYSYHLSKAAMKPSSDMTVTDIEDRIVEEPGGRRDDGQAVRMPEADGN